MSEHSRSTIPFTECGSTVPFTEDDALPALCDSFEKPLGDSSQTDNKHIVQRSTTDFPLVSRLENNDRGCRILIQPQDRSEFISYPDQPQRRSLLFDRSNPDCTGVECVVVTQTPDFASHIIRAPLVCELLYHPFEDYITVRNKSLSKAFDIYEITASGPNVRKHATVTPYCTQRLDPGCWSFCNHGQRNVLFQLKIYHRPWSLAKSQASVLKDTAGMKRKYGLGDVQDSGVVTKDERHLTQAACNMRLGVGETLHFKSPNKDNDYQICRLPGTTSFTRNSYVFKANVSRCGADVVIVKVIQSRTALEGTRAWMQECTIHKCLESDKIAKLLGFDARLNTLYIQYIAGFDLQSKHWCPRNDFMFSGGEHDAWQVLRDMSCAVHHVESQGLVHNDIKPANILYDPKTGAKLIDFGLGSTKGSNPRGGGTPWYIGPEYLFQGSRDAPADIWALGVVALYLLRLIPLPDSAEQAEPWQICDIVNLSDSDSAAKVGMHSWLGIIETTAREHLSNERQLHSTVKRMLSFDPCERISPDDLVARLASPPTTMLER